MPDHYGMVGSPNDDGIGGRKKKKGYLGLYNPPEFLNTKVARQQEVRENARQPKLRPKLRPKLPPTRQGMR